MINAQVLTLNTIINVKPVVHKVCSKDIALYMTNGDVSDVKSKDVKNAALLRFVKNVYLIITKKVINVKRLVRKTEIMIQIIHLKNSQEPWQTESKKDQVHLG